MTKLVKLEDVKMWLVHTCGWEAIDTASLDALPAALRQLPDAAPAENVADAYYKSLVEIREALGLSEHDTHEMVEQTIAELRRERDTLRAALQRAREDMAGWGAYADEHYRKKWGLAADLKAIDEEIERTK
jgi:microcystin degradation protein MlrC